MATAMERRYQLAREQLQTGIRQQTEQEKEALKRRFASQGGLGSGASIKAEQGAERAGARRMSEGMSSLEQARLAEESQLEQIQQQREFQTSERLGGQDFAGLQAALQREFQTGERLGSQDFVGSQSELQRKFQTGERLGSQDFAGSQAALQRQFQTGERLGSQEFAGQQSELGRNLTRELEGAKIGLGREQLGLERQKALGEIDGKQTLQAQQTEIERQKLYEQMNMNFIQQMFQDKEFAENVRISNENLALAKKQLQIYEDQANKGIVQQLGGNQDMKLGLPTQSGPSGGLGDPKNWFAGTSSPINLSNLGLGSAFSIF